MGELFHSDITQELLGKTITLHSPYFPNLPERVSGTVTYVEQTDVPHMVVVQQEGVGYMEIVDIDLYKNKELED